ncbi:kinase-like domain-containing protein [Chytridium lagenaria]|nr:kinase-like domain-containing protein [Chytridium lagenaria]
MKSLRKVDIVATKQVKHVMNEKTLLQSVRHPFIVNLLATFQDPKHLYLVMERGWQGFYTAEILLALEYIHAKDIVYRDLKPENILLGIDGHIKIADFGFAKRLRSDEKALTFCGTPHWWSLGIVCYELQAGYSPFQQKRRSKSMRTLWMGDRWSSQIGPVSKDLLKRGREEIKEHPWFKGEVRHHLFRQCGGRRCDNFDVYSDVSSVIMMQNGRWR